MFEHVDAYAGDPILTLVETFNKDTRESKVNLGIGLYYDEAGRIPLLESVRQAEAARAAQPAARPYQPMEGAASERYLAFDEQRKQQEARAADAADAAELAAIENKIKRRLKP